MGIKSRIRKSTRVIFYTYFRFTQHYIVGLSGSIVGGCIGGLTNSKHIANDVFAVLLIKVGGTGTTILGVCSAS